MSALRQALFTVIVSYACFSMSFVVAWPSSTVKLFSSANTTLNRPMSQTEIALFGGLLPVGALIGTPMSGFALDAIGRKNSCIVFSLPILISWLMVLLSNQVEVILAARFISGLSGSVIIIATAYVSEFCQESIRGMMTSGAMICYGTGILVSYLLVGFLEYTTLNYVYLSMAAFGIAIILPLKESPMYLIKNGREKEAEKSLSFFRGYKENSKEVMQDIITLKRAINPDIDDETPEEEKLTSNTVQTVKISKWRFFKKSQSSRKALLLALILFTSAVFQGLVAVQVYAEPLFGEALPNISTTLSSAIFALITVIAGCVGAYLVDTTGRRSLMIFASITTGICCVMLGSQIHLHWAPHWVTALFIYMYCIAFTFGASTVPYVVMAEVFLPEIKSLMAMFCMEWMWICNFVILFMFNPLVSLIGLGPVFYIFAFFAFATAVFCFSFLPETKGVPVDVIQSLFIKRKVSDTC